MPPPRTLGRRARRCTLSVALAAALLTVPLSAAPADAGAQEWIPPVDGRVVASFREPISRFGAGHRGVDFTAAWGTAVRAANDGRVSFAGDVAGSLHVVVAHDGGIRTSYSFLSRVDVGVGQQVRRGQIIGAAGGTGSGHGPGVLHFGVRIGERYVDPMLLFRPPDLTEIVRLVPADERAVADQATAEDEARGLRDALPARDGQGNGTEHECSGVVGEVADLIGLGGAAEEVCRNLPAFVVNAVEAGLEFAAQAGRDGLRLAAEFRKYLHGLVSLVEDAVNDVAGAFEALQDAMATAIGAAFRAFIALGQRLTEKLFACPQPPPDPHPMQIDRGVMAVAGLGSSRRLRRKGTRRSESGASFDFDFKTLGYQEALVDFYSYEPGSATYDPRATTGDLRVKARLLGEQIKAWAAQHPGVALDLVGHSQGGVVITQFLMHEYRGHEDEYPVIANVVTLASPLRGTPAANISQEVEENPGLAFVSRPIRGRFPIAAHSLNQLREGSRLTKNLWPADVRPPEGVRFLSIGAMEDPVVPTPGTDTGKGGRSIVVDAGAWLVPDDHTEILDDADALSAAQAWMAGGEPAGCGPAAGLPGEAYAAAIRVATTAIDGLSPGSIRGRVEVPRTSPVGRRPR